MQDYIEPRENRRGRARDRQMARKKRRDAVSSIKDTSLERLSNVSMPEGTSEILGKIRILIGDTLWYLFNRTPFLKIGGAVLGIGFLIYLASFVFSGKIFPNVWTMGIGLGDLTIDEAESQLLSVWHEEMQIQLMVDGEEVASVAPSDLGLQLDATATAEQARGVGLSGIPLGVSIDPVVNLDYSTAQNYLLNMTEAVYVPPYEAGYAWENDQLVSLDGRAGRQLDVSLSMERLVQDPIGIASKQRFDLFTTALLPSIVDASPYLDDAYAFLDNDLELIGYDPFSNASQPWFVSREEVAGWLSAGVNGLTIRENVFGDYIDSINASLSLGEAPRYIDEATAFATIQNAIRNNQASAQLRIRYRPREYEVVGSDTGFSIGRKTGIPFGLIDAMNPGLDWTALSVGQTITLPSRDELIPETPVQNKRIIVDLSRQWLIAFENDEVVFSWGISSGRESAPTYPGIFQILSQVDTAFGGSFALCDSAGLDCGQWQMSWFMGVYEVTPGLMNGFHGAVLLPNGAYLGGGGVNHPSTFGCVMSENGNAQQLYQWAEIGTMVEIISDEFPPESDLARRAVEIMDAGTST